MRKIRFFVRIHIARLYVWSNPNTLPNAFKAWRKYLKFFFFFVICVCVVLQGHQVQGRNPLLRNEGYFSYAAEWITKTRTNYKQSALKWEKITKIPDSHIHTHRNTYILVMFVNRKHVRQPKIKMPELLSVALCYRSRDNPFFLLSISVVLYWFINEHWVKLLFFQEECTQK